MKKVWVVWINFAPYSDPPKFVRAFTNEADATKFCIEHTQTLSAQGLPAARVDEVELETSTHVEEILDDSDNVHVNDLIEALRKDIDHLDPEQRGSELDDYESLRLRDEE